jgi:probable addiction module antidote protein
MTELAQKTGLSRESLYKTLNGVTKPRYESIQKILAALNIKFTLAAAE